MNIKNMLLKLIFILVIAFVLMGFFVVHAKSASTATSNRIGECYVFNMDVYLCSSIYSKYKFFGANLDRYESLPGLPKVVVVGNVGREIGDMKIDAVIPRGSKYTLTKLWKRREDFKNVITYIGDIEMSGGKIVGVISDHAQVERYVDEPGKVVFIPEIISRFSQSEAPANEKAKGSNPNVRD